MRVLSFLLLTVQILIMIGLDILLFDHNIYYGFGGIIGIIAYFIAYAISAEMAIAPRDFWFQTSWGIFKKKVAYAFSAYLTVTLLAAGILGACFS